MLTMFSRTQIYARTYRSLQSASLRQVSTITHTCCTWPRLPTRNARRISAANSFPNYFLGQVQSRSYVSKSTVDETIEEIQEQYGTARDEFEIATEETEKKSVYAEDDRAAAREETDRLKAMYQKALEGSDGEEVKSRVGQRIRELENAVEALEKAALEE